jgi:hypothetical protein
VLIASGSMQRNASRSNRGSHAWHAAHEGLGEEFPNDRKRGAAPWLRLATHPLGVRSAAGPLHPRVTASNDKTAASSQMCGPIATCASGPDRASPHPRCQAVGSKPTTLPLSEPLIVRLAKPGDHLRSSAAASAEFGIARTRTRSYEAITDDRFLTTEWLSPRPGCRRRHDSRITPMPLPLWLSIAIGATSDAPHRAQMYSKCGGQMSSKCGGQTYAVRRRENHSI